MQLINIMSKGCNRFGQHDTIRKRIPHLNINVYDTAGLYPRRLYSRRRWIEHSAFSLSVCLSACPRSKRKTAKAVETKLGRPIVRDHGSQTI